MNIIRTTLRPLGRLAVAVTLTASGSLAYALDDPALVVTDSGPVRGVVEEGTLSFRGIPFAQPPVGELRWRVPQPSKPWTEPLDASKLRSDCVQPAKASSANGLSEDCLYLNVWRRAAPAGKPLPVFVWIYGGGLVQGGASLYPAAQLVKRGILVVTFNYRLGRLGFFAHPALAGESPGDARGNYGYMDQIAALQWVQRNIAAFGGDPKHVTIAGESAGGGSVLVLLASPLARGLFHRAILQSPAIPTAREAALPMRSLADAEKIAVYYARTLGIDDQGAAGLGQLRATPASRLVEGTEGYLVSMFGGPPVAGLAHSIVDGRLVTETPERVLGAGLQAKVPVIVGANDQDLAWSAAQGKDDLFAMFGSHAARARELYDPAGDTPLPTLVQAVVADGIMLEPARSVAERITAGGQPAWHYRFAYRPRLRREQLRGASHGAELAFMFDATRLLVKDSIDDDHYVASTMTSYWTSFVRTGVPQAESRDAWPPYDPQTKKVFLFSNAGLQMEDDPWKERLDLWQAVREERAGP
jgi:para-nitrobenzyl esterase